ncbi:MAG TPA: S24 family peptidase [Candidatus Saccharimonadales bacterium]|nr:S24 family peptidase [Candidatus Saccharimonadales bacterium]
MNETREKLLNLARRQDISTMGLRELARVLNVRNPQTIKFHLKKLHESGLLNFDKPSVQIDRDKLGGSLLIRIPILGQVSAGPATQVADTGVRGYLRISSALLQSTNYKNLYALKVVGLSMNRANIHGRPVNDGDYAIVDSSKCSPRNGEYVIAVVDNLANLKRFIFDEENTQVVLLSESSEDYLPIFVHPEDGNEGLIRGTVVQIVKQPGSPSEHPAP